MVVKSQHIVPKSYLDNFNNEDGKLHCFNMFSREIMPCSSHKICKQKYSYESNRKHPTNILEKELSEIESRSMPEIAKVLKCFEQDDFSFEGVNLGVLFEFMMVMLIRTDSGRIMFMNSLVGNEGYDYHPTLEEIKGKNDEIIRFNKLFEKPGSLKRYLHGTYAKHFFGVRIGISYEVDLLTSDNPVVSVYLGEDKNAGIRTILPISPNVYLFCYNSSIKEIATNSKGPCYRTGSNLAHVYNECIIRAANNWVISKNGFSTVHQMLFYNKIRSIKCL